MRRSQSPSESHWFALTCRFNELQKMFDTDFESSSLDKRAQLMLDRLQLTLRIDIALLDHIQYLIRRRQLWHVDHTTEHADQSHVAEE